MCDVSDVLLSKNLSSLKIIRKQCVTLDLSSEHLEPHGTIFGTFRDLPRQATRSRTFDALHEESKKHQSKEQSVPSSIDLCTNKDSVVVISSGVAAEQSIIVE